MIVKGFKSFAVIPALALLLWSSGCQVARLPAFAVEDAATLAVDSLIEPDAVALSMIGPYKENLDATMNRVVGYAEKELRKAPVESPLGNFVADLIEEKAEEYAGYPVDMGAVTIGGLRTPIPEGPVKLTNLYELMPFENMLWILELSGEETQALFEYAAARKIIAISNSRLVVKDDRPLSVTINGEPLDKAKTYTLAISDYLANGGDDMFFLKEVKVLDRLEVKLRDVIIEKVAALQARGEKIDAEIEGRVVIDE